MIVNLFEVVLVKVRSSFDQEVKHFLALIDSKITCVIFISITMTECKGGVIRRVIGNGVVGIIEGIFQDIRIHFRILVGCLKAETINGK